LSFGAPAALWLLVALPIIWWLVRALPPPPRQVSFPAARLLTDGLTPERTPERTPLWLLALRLLAAACLILACARPVWSPAVPQGVGGTWLVVVDAGFASAPVWPAVRREALAVLTEAELAGAAVQVVTTPAAPLAPDSGLTPATSPADARRRLEALVPQGLPSDRARVLEDLKTGGEAPHTRVIWITDGSDLPSPATPAPQFAAALAALGPTELRVVRPEGPAFLSGVAPHADGLAVTLARVEASGPAASVLVRALAQGGTTLGSVRVELAAGARQAEAILALPAPVLARVSRLEIDRMPGAGAVWLVDGRAVRPRVGVAAPQGAVEPLVSPVFYVERALAVNHAVTTAALELLLEADPDAIVLTEAEVEGSLRAALIAWVEAGGLLVRFAAPRARTEPAAGTPPVADPLLPVRLRAVDRDLTGALAWGEPQAMAAFPATSPFEDLSPDATVRVRRQWLAEPDADLPARTWATLADGTPVITTRSLGAGRVVLFHVSARPDWSDLPLSGQFVALLARTLQTQATARSTALEAETLLRPEALLDGYGRLSPAAGRLEPRPARDLSDPEKPPPPPGLYTGSGGRLAVNATARGVPEAVSAWPGSVRVVRTEQATARRLDGGLFSLAIGLMLIDTLLAGWLMSGRMPGQPRRRAGALAGVVVALGTLAFPAADAQSSERSPTFFDTPSRRLQLPDAIAPAVELRLGYVRTGRPQLDALSAAGLEGLTEELWRRTSVEPGPPVAVDPATDPVELFSFLYLAVPDGAAQPLSPEVAAGLNRYLRSGGALLIDTRDGGTRPEPTRLGTALAGLDVPELAIASRGHVLHRTFYLLEGVQGRNGTVPVWIAAAAAAEAAAPRAAAGPSPDASPEAGGDRVSGVFIGGGDWAAAWARSPDGRALLPVEGGERARELAVRFGINLVMYVLTGSYKDDQVHVPTLLERMGEGEP
jgi:hypothetical protein